jgi:hypothetical protein
MNDYQAVKVSDVKGRFDSLPKNGTYEKFTNFPYYDANIGVDHIQGYTQYQGSNGKEYIFTHSEERLVNTGNGRVIFMNSPTTHPQPPVIAAPKSGYYHVGGIQAVGKYLFVPFTNNKDKLIAVYDLETPKRTLVASYGGFPGSSALGITDFIYKGEPHYLLIVNNGVDYHIYTAPIPKDGVISNKTAFSYYGVLSLKGLPKKIGQDGKINCQGFGLVTETSGLVYMIALETHDKVVEYEDWAYLIQMTTPDGQIGLANVNEIKSKHLYSNKSGGMKGNDGTHFRWGSGIHILPEGKLVILATRRNILNPTISTPHVLDTYYWISN